MARELESRGIPVREGMRVSYYVFDGSDGVQVAPIEDLSPEKPVDRYYMWEQKIFPPTMRLLQAAFPDYPWEDTYGKQRPERAKRGVLEGQMGLFGGDPVKVRPVLKLVQGGLTRAVRWVVDESCDWASVVHAAAQMAPGEAVLDIVVRLDSGAEAELRVPVRVDPIAFEDAFFAAWFSVQLGNV